jgi:uncharacterized protein YlxW (UPF0749 family)
LQQQLATLEKQLEALTQSKSASTSSTQHQVTTLQNEIAAINEEIEAAQQVSLMSAQSKPLGGHPAATPAAPTNTGSSRVVDVKA